jgi:hypothetical protein
LSNSGIAFGFGASDALLPPVDGNGSSDAVNGELGSDVRRLDKDPVVLTALEVALARHLPVVLAGCASCGGRAQESSARARVK